MEDVDAGPLTLDTLENWFAVQASSLGDDISVRQTLCSKELPSCPRWADTIVLTCASSAGNWRRKLTDMITALRPRRMSTQNPQLWKFFNGFLFLSFGDKHNATLCNLKLQQIQQSIALLEMQFLFQGLNICLKSSTPRIGRRITLGAVEFTFHGHACAAQRFYLHSLSMGCFMLQSTTVDVYPCLH